MRELLWAAHWAAAPALDDKEPELVQKDQQCSDAKHNLLLSQVDFHFVSDCQSFDSLLADGGA